METAPWTPPARPPYESPAQWWAQQPRIEYCRPREVLPVRSQLPRVSQLSDWRPTLHSTNPPLTAPPLFSHIPPVTHPHWMPPQRPTLAPGQYWEQPAMAVFPSEGQILPQAPGVTPNSPFWNPAHQFALNPLPPNYPQLNIPQMVFPSTTQQLRPPLIPPKNFPPMPIPPSLFLTEQSNPQAPRSGRQSPPEMRTTTNKHAGVGFTTACAETYGPGAGAWEASVNPDARPTSGPAPRRGSENKPSMAGGSAGDVHSDITQRSPRRKRQRTTRLSLPADSSEGPRTRGATEEIEAGRLETRRTEVSDRKTSLWQSLPYHMKTSGRSAPTDSPRIQPARRQINRHTPRRTTPQSPYKKPYPVHPKQPRSAGGNVYSNYNVGPTCPALLQETRTQTINPGRDPITAQGYKPPSDAERDPSLPQQPANPQHFQRELPGSATAPEEDRGDIQAIPNPLRDTIQDSPYAPKMPSNWFQILSIGHYGSLDRDFARTLRGGDVTLLRAFVMADINLLARDLKLNLTLRGLARAKYGMRSEAIAQLLGIESTAQLLIKMNAWVCAHQELQAHALPGTPTSLGIHIPRISPHYIPERLRERISSTDYLFLHTPGIHPILATGPYNTWPHQLATEIQCGRQPSPPPKCRFALQA